MEPAPSSHQRIQTVCLMILATVALGAALRWLSPVMVPFMLAFFLTVVLTPVVEIFHRRLKLPVILALLLTGVIGLGALVGLGSLVATSVAELQENEDEYVERFEDLEEDLRDSWLGPYLGLAEEQAPDEEGAPDEDEGADPEPGPGLDVLDPISLTQAETLEPEESPGGALPPEMVQRFLSSAVNALLDILSQGVLVMIFMMFLVSGRAHSGMLGDVEQRIKGYVMTKVVVSSITGVLTWLILMLLGVEMALVFGLFAFLLNFVPSIGSIIATVLPLPIVLIGDYSTATQIAAIALPGAVQFGVGNLLEPRMLGESMDLHPVTILLALIFWGMIWGFVGALLATPITAVVRILLDRIDVTRPVADLMAGRAPGGAATPAESSA